MDDELEALDSVLDVEEVGMSEEVSMLSSGDGFSSSAGISSFGSGGIGGSGVPPLSREGNEAAGDGGGRTKEPASNGGGGTGDAVILVLNSGICREGDAVTDLPASAAADRKSTRLNSSHSGESRMPSSA